MPAGCFVKLSFGHASCMEEIVRHPRREGICVPRWRNGHYFLVSYSVLRLPMNDLLSMLAPPVAEQSSLPKHVRSQSPDRSDSHVDSPRKKRDVSHADDAKPKSERTRVERDKPKNFETVLNEAESKPVAKAASPSDSKRIETDSENETVEPTETGNLNVEDQPEMEVVALAWMLGGEIDNQRVGLAVDAVTESGVPSLLQGGGKVMLGMQPDHTMGDVVDSNATLELSGTDVLDLAKTGKVAGKVAGEVAQTAEAISAAGDEGISEVLDAQTLAPPAVTLHDGRQKQAPNVENAQQATLAAATGTEKGDRVDLAPIANDDVAESGNERETEIRATSDTQSQGESEAFAEPDNSEPTIRNGVKGDVRPSVSGATAFETVDGESSSEGVEVPAGNPTVSTASSESNPFAFQLGRTLDVSSNGGTAAGLRPTGQPISHSEQVEQAFRAQMASRLQPAIESAQWGETKVQIDLDPPELGALRVSIHRGAQGVQVSILTDNAGSTQLLESNLRELVDSLQQVGVDLQDVNVSQGFEQRQQRESENQSSAAPSSPQDVSADGDSMESGDVADGRDGDSTRVNLVA